MAGPKSVVEPHKELRFTRASQAQTFWVIGAIFGVLTVLLLANWLSGHPSFSWWMGLISLGVAAIFVRFAIQCTRHAYLILTPLGVEIFPLRKPEINLHLIYWTELADADFDEELTTLKLHYDAEKSAGVVLSLKPILEKQRPLHPVAAPEPAGSLRAIPQNKYSKTAKGLRCETDSSQKGHQKREASGTESKIHNDQQYALGGESPQGRPKNQKFAHRITRETALLTQKTIKPAQTIPALRRFGSYPDNDIHLESGIDPQDGHKSNKHYGERFRLNSRYDRDDHES